MSKISKIWYDCKGISADQTKIEKTGLASRHCFGCALFLNYRPGRRGGPQMKTLGTMFNVLAVRDVRDVCDTMAEISTVFIMSITVVYKILGK